MSSQSATHTERVPLRRRLLLLVAAAIVPLAAMAGVGFVALLQAQQSRAEQSVLDVTRALATAVDTELRSAIQVLEAVATASALDRGDLATFQERARVVVGGQPLWRSIILAAPDGQPLMNTAIAAGQPMFPIVERESFDRVLATVRPGIGSIAAGPQGEYAVAVRVPVIREGKLRYVLSAVLRPEAIVAVINRQRVPPDGIVSVFDSHQRRVARSRSHEQYIAAPPSPSLVEMMSAGTDEGTGITYSLEGTRNLAAYTRIPSSGWSVAIGVSDSLLEESFYGSLGAYGGGVLLSLGLGVIAALLVAQSISRPMDELRRSAQLLDEGERPALPEGEIQEIQEVADALAASADARRRMESAREQLFLAERTARTAAERARQRLEILASAGAVLSHSLEPQSTLEAIATNIVPAIADWCRIDLIDARGQLQRGLTYHADPDKARAGTEMAARLKAAPGAVGSMSWVVATGKPYLAHFDPPVGLDEIRDRDLLVFARAIGMRTYYIVPLVARGRTLGAMAAVQAESGRDLSEEDCALVAELGQRAAMALDNARLYAEAETALAQARSANRAKDEFMAMLSHELRNPLAPIVTALKLMEMRGSDANRMERDIIERQVSHMVRLVDDLLDISRITRGKIQLTREPLDMRDVVARALELTEPLFARRAQPLAVGVLDAPAPVSGDPVRLAQVISNLLINAAKFTPEDQAIRLSLNRDGHWIQLVVEDEGIGIDASLLPLVFDLFVQGTQTIERSQGGLGLGLAIVKSIVTMHGGTVDVESAGKDRGSRFIVRLPVMGI